MKKRKQTVVTGDLKPMTDTLNQVLEEEIKTTININSTRQKSERKVSITEWGMANPTKNSHIC